MNQFQQEDRVERATLQMLRDPDTWPRWPFLPLKKRGQFHKPDGMGFLFGDPTRPIVVYIGNMIAWNQGNLQNIPKKEYDTPEAVIADGWVVD